MLVGDIFQLTGQNIAPMNVDQKILVDANGKKALVDIDGKNPY